VLQFGLFDKISGESAIRVEFGGAVHAVVGGICTCGSKSCAHIRRAGRYASMEKGLKYVAKSGLHKELRTGHIGRAIAFGAICEMYQKGEVKRYLRKVLFEETRNVDLLKRIVDSRPGDWRDLVSLFCRSKKDWQFSWDVGWFSPSWVNSLYGQRKWPEELIDLDAFRDFVEGRVRVGAFGDVYPLVVLCGLDSGGDVRAQKKILAGVLLDHVNKNTALGGAATDLLLSMQNDEMTVLFEMASGVFTDEANEYGEPLGVDGIGRYEMPDVGEYVFDMHTWEGKNRLRRAGGGVRAGEPLPGRMDIRLSGAEGGTIWRYEAFSRFNRIDVPWEDVTLSSDLAHRANEITDPWDGKTLEVTW